MERKKRRAACEGLQAGGGKRDIRKMNGKLIEKRRKRIISPEAFFGGGLKEDFGREGESTDRV